jgi:hypothetical protein
MCTQIFVKFPCGCARKYETISCYKDYTCPPNVIKREDVPVSTVKGPKVKQDVAGPARGDRVRTDGRKEAAKLGREEDRGW